MEFPVVPLLCSGFSRFLGLLRCFRASRMSCSGCEFHHETGRKRFAMRPPFLKRSLSFVEVLGVVALLVLLAAGGSFCVTRVQEWFLAKRVQAAWPVMGKGIRAQRLLVVNALEAYHQRFGCYPPDTRTGPNPQIVDPVFNPLLYELSGVLYDSGLGLFTGTGFPPLTVREVQTLFRLSRFTNTVPATPGAVPENFLNSLQTTVFGIHEMPDVSTFGYLPPPEEMDPEVCAEFDISPWRYVSSNPTNNPGKYDLWMELGLGNRRQVIGNWQAVD